jgi:hypothetical protein
MARLNTLLSGPALASALLLALVAACAPIAQPPNGGIVEAAAAALRRGDTNGLRAALGHTDELAKFAAAQARQLDPEAWLIVMGASWREHDTAACAAALDKGDGEALLKALGFGEQQLRADVLDAGRTVYSRRAAAMDYYETGEAPIAAMQEDLLPPLPGTLRACELTFWGTRKSRVMRLRTGLNERGLTNMQASLGLATTAFSAPAGAKRTPQPTCDAMPLPALTDAQWWGLEARIVTREGAILQLKLGRDDGGWFVVESSETSLRERLDTLRDRRLQAIRRLASDHQRSAGRWPRYVTDLTLRPRDLVDPAAPEGRLGWAELAPRPESTIRLLQAQDGDDVAAECVHAGPRGRRAVTRAGALGWR